MQFNSAIFEELRGHELARHTVQLLKSEISSNNFISYFSEKAAALDAAHLQSALVLLQKIGTARALRFVADYLQHPDFSVRFAAIRAVSQMVVVDEYIMKRVTEALSKVANDPDALAQELKSVLDRSLNEEAGRIASEYRRTQSPHVHDPGL